MVPSLASKCHSALASRFVEPRYDFVALSVLRSAIVTEVCGKGVPRPLIERRPALTLRAGPRTFPLRFRDRGSP
jgi:hypothetical protein